VWYFTSFSQPLASAISSSVADYFQSYVYSDRVNRNRGAKYSYYWVTLAQDFPSVLVELGFVTNMEDAMAMANPIHQTGIANAIANGIQRYLNRSNISYSADGSIES
jgi:N-acetylmuramoyl-L-alanine amidase